MSVTDDLNARMQDLAGAVARQPESAPRSLLSELLASADTGAADQLRTAAAALQPELNAFIDPIDRDRAPHGADVLAVARMPYADPRGLGWIVLRLLTAEQATVELWARATPYNYTDTRCEARLATLTVDTRDSVQRALVRFVAEARVHGALPQPAVQA